MTRYSKEFNLMSMIKNTKTLKRPSCPQLVGPTTVNQVIKVTTNLFSFVNQFLVAHPLMTHGPFTHISLLKSLF